MGLIKSLTSSVSSGFGDQFKEYVTCPTIEKNVLIQRGIVQHGPGNKNYTEGVISNGSTIVVPQGMAMMIIDNGAIKEFSSEPGTYTWDSSSEPSVFTGGFFNGLGETIKTIGNRFTYGGQAAKDQRVYYVNLLKITGNKFGSPQPKKITDEKYGMLEVTFFGEYAFQVVDPVILVQNVIGANPKDTITYEDVVGTQLKGKFVEQLTQAISVVMRKYKVSFGDMGLYGTDLSNEMNTILDESWRREYGLEITDVALSDINLTDESMARVSKIDDATIFSNPNLQSGLMATSVADAMKSAASNENGAMMGFMGMNMAQQGGANMMGAINQNVNANQSFAYGNPAQPEPGTLFANNQANEVKPMQEENKSEENVSQNTQTEEPVQGENNKKFCENCGTIVSEGAKFCGNCGKQI
ncbi:MAG: SPFH domain-containing protein [Clostridium sp.]|nr:SPFH domain-containing protein [Clostridium sp.]MCM1444551.1 SPFH domain-containing protein [Candidatus Amulumruptor caecigallinarius]